MDVPVGVAGLRGRGVQGGRVTRQGTDPVAGVCRGRQRAGVREERGARLACGRDGGQMRK
ncbi:hypothetical protein E2C01_099695 [Portunus trituberculatus]|uniref:Uncharacterized protein n=1 Tax=Portunus trituberculatus TaxID=210409 RepID=A0A5B7KBK2_PORTR|nr:hypothetical protein [Portunus trituberculatus]